MLSAEDNEILTRVGPGTPMGNLLRRYWIPACLSSEIGEPDGPPARVRHRSIRCSAGMSPPTAPCWLTYWV